MKLFEDKDKERLERRRGAKVRHLDARKGGQCTYRMVANGSVGGGRRGGRRCHGAIKIGTIIIQEGQLTAEGGKKGGGRCPGATGTIIIIQGGHLTAGPARGGKIDGDGDVLIPQQVEPF